MSYMTFNIIFITELDGRAFWKTIQTYGVQIKTFEIKNQNENTH